MAFSFLHLGSGNSLKTPQTHQSIKWTDSKKYTMQVT